MYKEFIPEKGSQLQKQTNGKMFNLTNDVLIIFIL